MLYYFKKGKNALEKKICTVCGALYYLRDFYIWFWLGELQILKTSRTNFFRFHHHINERGMILVLLSMTGYQGIAAWPCSYAMTVL